MRQRERVQCPHCKVDLAERYLTAHYQSQNVQGRGLQYTDSPPPSVDCRVSFMRTVVKVACPVEGYRGEGGAIITNLQIHFLLIHVWDIIVILEEVNHPHPFCPD